MRCAYCGTENPPGTRLCTNCRFILREEDIVEEPEETTWGWKPSYGVTSSPRKKSRLHTIIAIVVGVAIVIGLFALGNTYSSDPSMNALLFYSYQASADAVDGTVRIWGHVSSSQTETVEASLKVVITDVHGHSSTERIYVGVLDAYERADVDQRVPWPYLCFSVDELTVTYDILTRSPSLF